MQNLAARSDTQQHELYSKRKQHYACHLMFVAKVYKEEVDNARHAHIEQPEKALSWRATAFKDLPGYWIVLHQCMFGCACLEQDGWWKLVKKPTGILPSKASMQAALSKQCDGQHIRCPLEGSASGFGRHTSYLEDYQPGLAAAIAAAVTAPDPAQLWDYGFAVCEQKELTGCLVKPQTALEAVAPCNVCTETLDIQSLRPWWNYFRAEEPVIKSLRQLAISNALHASATSDQTRWQLLHCDIKLMKLVNACRPMCCGSNATAVPRSFPASVSLTRPQSMSPYQATPIASAKPGAELLVPVVCFGP